MECSIKVMKKCKFNLINIHELTPVGFIILTEYLKLDTK